MVAPSATSVNIMNRLIICFFNAMLSGHVLLDALGLVTYLVILINADLGLSNGYLKVKNFMFWARHQSAGRFGKRGIKLVLTKRSSRIRWK